ncbi:MAG: type II secretion system protein [Phycisphaerales bacterium]
MSGVNVKSRYPSTNRRSIRRPNRGFTLVDVLVSIAVIMVLISLMMPALSKATETAHRLVCSSNVRQIGIAMLMYADSNNDYIPPTTFYDPTRNRAEQMLILRLSSVSSAPRDYSPETGGWDGLGLLYFGGYIDHAACFYCPSHDGAHPLSQYSNSFGDVPEVVVGNYQYRGAGPLGQRHLSKIEPRRTALVADGMRLRSDYNHDVGSNVMRADLSVTWFRDYGGRILSRLPLQEADARSSVVMDAWELIDDQLDGSSSGDSRRDAN